MPDGFRGILDIISGAKAGDYTGRMEEYGELQGLKRQSLMDIMTQKRREKDISRLVGTPAGPISLGRGAGEAAGFERGSGLYGLPQEQALAKLQLSSLDPTLASAFLGSFQQPAPGATRPFITTRDEKPVKVTQEYVQPLPGATGEYQELGVGPAFAPARGGGGATARPHLARVMSEGWQPSQRLTGDQADMLEQSLAIYAQDNEGKLPTPKEMRGREFTARKNWATGASAGSRLVIARKQNIAAALPLLDDIEETGTKLDFSNVQWVGTLDKWYKGQLNDPILTEYMTQRADALFVLGNALKQNGLTDKAIAVEEEAARPTMSPRSLKAWLNTQRRALNRAAAEIEEDYGYELERAPVTPAGVGGAGLRTAPRRRTEEEEEIIDWEDLS